MARCAGRCRTCGARRTSSSPRTRTPGSRGRDGRRTSFDYLYLATTNSIAFSPTDAMPLTRPAKALMALESVVSVVALLLVAARAVNILQA